MEISWNKISRNYGSRDNSVTDRMYYEVADAICSAIKRAEDAKLESVQLTRKEMIAVVAPLLPAQIQGVRNRNAATAAIIVKLEKNASWGRRSRIAIEDVRATLEHIVSSFQRE